MKKFLFVYACFINAVTFGQTSNVKALDSLTSVYEQNNFHGVVLLAKGDKILYENAYGFADLDKKIKHTSSTEFLTESVGKMFTATSVFQLVEKNKLRLSQTVKELLPGLRIRNADKITIHHLLNHTSGLQSPWDHANWSFKKRYTRSELNKIVEELPLAFDTPGKEMYYSNSGYFILGWIIEKVSGKPYDEYFKKNIFKKLGMSSTRHLNDTVMKGKGAQPYYVFGKNKYAVQNETVGPIASAAGGWISTAKDLYKFMYGLTHGKLIKPATLQIMNTANNSNPKDSAYRFYAYGLETYRNQPIAGTKIFGHNGGGAGFSVDAFYEANSDHIIISCTNLYQNSRPIAMNYLRLALNKPLQPITIPAAVRLYDLIDSVGLDNFIKNEKEHFNQLKINVNPGVFAELSNAFDKTGDHAKANKWLQLARTNYPDEGFLWIISGDNQFKLNNPAEGKRMYEQAKEIGIKRNDQRVINAADEKLKAFSK